MSAERIAYSDDAAQFIYIRRAPWDDEGECVEVECVNKSRRTDVWLSTEGIDQLITALQELRNPVEDE